MTKVIAIHMHFFRETESEAREKSAQRANELMKQVLAMASKKVIS